MSKAVEDAIKAYLTKVVDSEGYDAPYIIVDDDTLGIEGWFSTSGIAKAAADAARRELLNALAKYRYDDKDRILAWHVSPEGECGIIDLYDYDGPEWKFEDLTIDELIATVLPEDAP